MLFQNSKTQSTQRSTNQFRACYGMDTSFLDTPHPTDTKCQSKKDKKQQLMFKSRHSLPSKNTFGLSKHIPPYRSASLQYLAYKTIPEASLATEADQIYPNQGAPRSLFYDEREHVQALVQSEHHHSADSKFVGEKYGKLRQRQDLKAFLPEKNRNDINYETDYIAEYSDLLNAQVTDIHSHFSGTMFYEIQVNLSQQKWLFYRRYSEFRHLREQLLKHFSKIVNHQKNSVDRCPVCISLLCQLLECEFPSRHTDWKTKYLPLPGSALGLDPNQRRTTRCTRKFKLQNFLVICVFILKSLRNHTCLVYQMPRKTNRRCLQPCETYRPIQILEEFFKIDSKRYIDFLSERGCSLS